MSRTLHLKVLTPEGSVYEALDVDRVSVMTLAGEITVLPNHLAYISPLVNGEMRIFKNETMTPYTVSNGVIVVERKGEETLVSILTEGSYLAKDLNEELLEAAILRAHEAMADTNNILEVDFAQFQSQIQRDTSKLKIAKKWRK